MDLVEDAQGQKQIKLTVPPTGNHFLSFAKETYLTHKDPVILAQWVRELKEVIEKQLTNQSSAAKPTSTLGNKVLSMKQKKEDGCLLNIRNYRSNAQTVKYNSLLVTNQ